MKRGALLKYQTLYQFSPEVERAAEELVADYRSVIKFCSQLFKYKIRLNISDANDKFIPAKGVAE